MVHGDSKLQQPKASLDALLRSLDDSLAVSLGLHEAVGMHNGHVSTSDRAHNYITACQGVSSGGFMSLTDSCSRVCRCRLLIC